jgi:hypothetical protein
MRIHCPLALIRRCAFVGAAALIFASTGAAAEPVYCGNGLWYPDGVCPSAGPVTPPQPPPPPRAGAAAEVSGDVTFVYPDGSSHTAAAGEPLPIGARVITGPAGSLKVALLDGTVISFGPNSDMVVDEFVYNPGESDRFLARITKGIFRFVAGQVSHRPDQWRVNVPSGAVGIRGTTFDVTADPGGSGEISVEEGEIVLTEYDTAKEWVVDAGQKLVVDNFQVVGVQ